MDNSLSNQINNKDKYFKGQQQFEEILHVTRKHWIILVSPTIGFIAASAVFLGLVYLILLKKITLSENWIYQISAIITVGIFTYLTNKYFNYLLNYYLDVILITNYRIIYIEKSLFLKDEKDAIDLHEIQDIKKSQLGILKNLFNYGEIIISQSGSEMLKTLIYIPLPDHFFRKVNLAKRNYILERRNEKIINRQENNLSAIKESYSENLNNILNQPH